MPAKNDATGFSEVHSGSRRFEASLCTSQKTLSGPAAVEPIRGAQSVSHCRARPPCL